jgi:hypothetical protein
MTDQDKQAPDVVLTDGREITFDLTKMTIGEYRRLFDKTQTPDDEDAIIAKIAGIEAEDIKALNFIEYHRFINAFFKRSANPLSGEAKA